MSNEETIYKLTVLQDKLADLIKGLGGYPLSLTQPSDLIEYVTSLLEVLRKELKGRGL